MSKWKQFLDTDYAKENVPERFDKVQAVIHCAHEGEEQPAEVVQPENSHEEWMIISDLHEPFADSFQPNYNWHLDRCHYTEQQIGEMSKWIINAKEDINTNCHGASQNIDLSQGCQIA